MGTEIERKFLVVGDAWRGSARAATAYVQGYLSTEPSRTVRVRVAGDRGFLTVKGKTTGAMGATRDEFEYEVPLDDARQMLALCERRIEKTRHLVPHEGHGWEVDVFEGENAGLVVAEVELVSEDEPFARPPWLGKEVTGDGRYANASLVNEPYSAWGPSAEKEPRRPPQR